MFERLNRDRLVLAATGGLFFVYRYGLGVLDPTRTDWLLGRSDPAMNLISWFFYRGEPWSYPPGQILSYNWPEGTSVALTDSLPLLALPFKLFSGVLPPDFHYWGIWLLICHVLQAIFAHALVSTISKSRRVQISGTLLALFMPVWLHRIGHMALSAHWVPLAAWWLYLREGGAEGLRARLERWGLLLGTTAWIHPYLWVMAFTIGLAGWARSWRHGLIRVRAMVVLTACMIALALVAWHLGGMFELHGLDQYREEGLGNYSMNLNALWNSHATSRWLPPLQLRTPGQFEGFNYLGAALLALLPVVLASIVVTPSGRRAFIDHREAAALCVLATVYALGPQWSYANTVVLEMPWPAWLQDMGQVFRATGRFFWICQYALLAMGIRQVLVVLGTRRAGWVLGIAALCTAVEMQPMERVDRFLVGRRFVPRFDMEAVAPWVPEGGLVIPVPPGSRTLVHPDDWREWALMARRRGASYGGGYVARVDKGARSRFAEQVRDDLQNGTLDPRAVYVLDPATMSEIVADSARAVVVEGYSLVGPGPDAAGSRGQ